MEPTVNETMENHLQEVLQKPVTGQTEANKKDEVNDRDHQQQLPNTTVDQQPLLVVMSPPRRRRPGSLRRTQSEYRRPPSSSSASQVTGDGTSQSQPTTVDRPKSLGEEDKHTLLPVLDEEIRDNVFSDEETDKNIEAQKQFDRRAKLRRELSVIIPDDKNNEHQDEDQLVYTRGHPATPPLTPTPPGHTIKPGKAATELIMERFCRWRCQCWTSERAVASRRRIAYYIKVFLTHLFSTAGLCSLVAAYSVLGAITFEWLESTHDIDVRKEVTDRRRRCAFDLWNLTMHLNVLYEDNWTSIAQQRIKEFEQDIVDYVRKKGYDGLDAEKMSQWSFSGALLYSITVITTIGYGNVTCKTTIGQAVTIIYALFGIPVMFLCLANLGNLMANTFKFSYRKIRYICCCCSERNICARICCPDPKPTRNDLELRRRSSQAKSNQIKSSVKKKKQSVSSIKDTKVIITEEPKPIAKTIVNSRSSSPEAPPSPSSPTDELECLQYSPEVVVTRQTQPKIKNPDDRVPIIIVLALVIGYIIGGAMLFAFWEGWNPLEGAYFCFITLSTIGFGDYVPGAAINQAKDREGQIQLIICAVYLFTGLSLLAMSFNLVQEEIVIRCRGIAARIGILPQKNEIENARPATV